MARRPVTTDIEVFPEADRLEGYPHPRETLQVHGHQTAEEAFGESFRSGRLHHGWLISGKRGIGKATLGYKLARYLLAEPEERLPGGIEIVPDGTTWRQALALSHPRLLLIRRPYDIKAKRFAASIPVDEVRRLRSFLAHSAGPGAWRVVMVDQADELNGPAANALLKALEEPPQRCVFLLISSEPGRLLATVKSRCRRLDLDPLNDADFARAVSQAREAGELEPFAGEELQRLAAIAQGSVRRALQLSEADGIALQSRVSALLGMLPKVDWPGVHALADEVTGAGSEQRFEIFFDLLLETVADMVHARATGGAMRCGGIDCGRVIDEGRLAGWAELWERVVARKAEAMVLNLDRRALVIETVGRLQALARG
ncbi:MAG: hypothetical protein RLZ98_1398 [Pseudomonadota bacterium]